MDPLWTILRHQGRDMGWLASRTGYSHSHVRAIASGRFKPSADFRSKAAFAMDLPESVLFRQHETPASEEAAVSS